MLHPFLPETVKKLTATRPGEQKLGESISILQDLNRLSDHSARFVLLGIAEDIGIRANLGKPGAAQCWESVLPAILSVQHNQFLDAKDILLGGILRFDELVAESQKLNPAKEDDLQRLRQMTAEIDQTVSNVIQTIARAGKIPIVIGGGHNNAYGLIKGTSSASGQSMNVLNIDPHADYRAPEGRHSGNAFRYARDENLLQRYAVWGWQESYNNQEMLERFAEDADLHFESLDQILSLTVTEKDQRFKNVLQWLGFQSTGLELDLDCLTEFPVSARNPSGFTLNEARHYVKTTAALSKPLYFHLPEGSPGQAQSEAEKQMLGKSLAFLVTDFVKAYDHSSL